MTIGELADQNNINIKEAGRLMFQQLESKKKEFLDGGYLAKKKYLAKFNVFKNGHPTIDEYYKWVVGDVPIQKGIELYQETTDEITKSILGVAKGFRAGIGVIGLSAEQTEKTWKKDCIKKYGRLPEENEKLGIKSAINH